MSPTIPIVLCLGVLTLLFVYTRLVDWWVAGTIFLFGIYVGLTPADKYIVSATQSIINYFSP